MIASAILERAAEAQVSVVENPGLLSEVAGLVEWPVALRGRIDAVFMDLPPEVMQVSMRVNQRYFATRTAEGRPPRPISFLSRTSPPRTAAPRSSPATSVCCARVFPTRGISGTSIAAPAWPIASPPWTAVTFQAALGSQGARARRLSSLAADLAPYAGADPHLASRAARLAKADLTTGMVGEFPELQGVMGGYYARHDGEPEAVADAVRDHYLPKGPGDAVPTAPVSIAAALADKIDQLAAFFAIGEKPSGSGDPYALRPRGARRHSHRARERPQAAVAPGSVGGSGACCRSGYRLPPPPKK